MQRNPLDIQPGAGDEATVEQVVRIETPENAVLTYRLAGPSVRLIAYLMDLSIRIVIVMTFNMMTSALRVVLPGLTEGATLILLFLVQWAYYPLCEGYFNGRTFGKMFCRLRVIQNAGYPITLRAAIVRNLLRVADSVPLYGTALVVMLFAGRFRRLGDLAARTIVIEERAVYLPHEPIILDTISPLLKSDIGTYVPDDLTMSDVEQFLRRRSVLNHRHGHAIARRLADVLAERLGYRGDPEQVQRFPMAFLARVYVTFHVPRDDADDAQLVRELRRPTLEPVR